MPTHGPAGDVHGLMQGMMGGPGAGMPPPAMMSRMAPPMRGGGGPPGVGPAAAPPADARELVKSEIKRAYSELQAAAASAGIDWSEIASGAGPAPRAVRATPPAPAMRALGG